MKVNLIIAIVVFVIITILYLMFYFTKKKKDSLQKENEKLQNELKDCKSNICYLMKHIQEMAKIKSEESQIDDLIDKAKTDEEIFDLVNTIISVNNSKLQDN